MDKTVCAYCLTVNSAKAETCLACGAPLPRPVLSPTLPKPTGAAKPPVRDFTTDDLRKAGEAAEKAYYVYGIFWRTLAEAAAIAVAGLTLGMVGGITHMPAWGVITAALLGVVVGLTRKMVILTVFGAPVGTLVGAVLWLIPWGLGVGPKGMIFSAALFGILGAVIFRSPPLAHKDWWERLRPFLGGLGGLAFGLLGALLGAGLDWLITAAGI